MLQLDINHLLPESSSALLKSWSSGVRNWVLSSPDPAAFSLAAGSGDGAFCLG